VQAQDHVGETMMKSILTVLAAVLICTGCQSRQKRMFEQFQEMEMNNVAAYTNATAPSIAIPVLVEYLSEIDRFERAGLEGIYFDRARSFAEARLSELYFHVGQYAKADEMVNLAIHHFGNTNLTPEAMYNMVQKLDEHLKPRWRNQ
jgi:uncharacterized lipoprotein NlpE involved in copper resistance